MFGKRGFYVPPFHPSYFPFHISYSSTVSPQKYWNKVYRYLALAGVLLVLVGAAFAFFPKVNQFRNYQDIKAGLKADIRAEEERIKDLRSNQEKFSTDKRFVEKIAHEIGFAHEGETIYQFDEPAQTNSRVQTNQ
jgi:cell division protein FtsB